MNTQNTFKMLVLPTKPEAVTVFSKDNAPDKTRLEPYVVGEGVLDYTCGKCNHTMLKALRWGQVTQAVYKCPKCGSYNKIEPIIRKH